MFLMTWRLPWMGARTDGGFLVNLVIPGTADLVFRQTTYLNGVFWVALSHLAFVFFLILLEHGHH